MNTWNALGWIISSDALTLPLFPSKISHRLKTFQLFLTNKTKQTGRLLHARTISPRLSLILGDEGKKNPRERKRLPLERKLLIMIIFALYLFIQPERDSFPPTTTKKKVFFFSIVNIDIRASGSAWPCPAAAVLNACNYRPFFFFFFYFVCGQKYIYKGRSSQPAWHYLYILHYI